MPESSGLVTLCSWSGFPTTAELMNINIAHQASPARRPKAVYKSSEEDKKDTLSGYLPLIQQGLSQVSQNTVQGSTHFLAKEREAEGSNGLTQS